MIHIYTLTSPLHDEHAVAAVTKEFLGSLGLSYELRGADYADYGKNPAALSLLYVRTGGTEGVFRQLLSQLLAQSKQPFYLLTSGKSNSLAASMEILSFLRQQGLEGEILHGSSEYVRHRVEVLEKVAQARHWLHGKRVGVIGEPSDWLIASQVNPDRVKERLGVEIVKIPMKELTDAFETVLVADVASDAGKYESQVAPLNEADAPSVKRSLSDALRLYVAMKELVARHELQGLTIRCFDLLTSIRNTGCMALARLNSEGYVAGCEGDVPAMLSMLIARSVLGVSGFQANPSHIDPPFGEVLFAHCTIPFQMTKRFELDTHFESGIGVGIRGYVDEGPVTVFKVSGALDRHFIAEGVLTACQAEGDLCRTQQVVRLLDASQAQYFLTCPIGNHHIILPGHLKEVLAAMLS